MKIAVIVHNPIYKDARVRKESRTLKDNGFDLILIGYGSDENIWTEIENCRTKIIKKISYNPLKAFKNFFQKITYSELNIFKSFLQKIKKRFDLTSYLKEIINILIFTFYIINI